MSDQDYDKWRRRLAGDFLPIDPNIPEAGCYRIRRGGLPGWDAVQIWHVVDQRTGEVQSRTTRNGVACRPQIVWPQCAERPVSTTAYKRFADTGKWPDEVAQEAIPEGGNFVGAPEHEKFLAAITALEADAIGWFELIGSAIKTQEHADKAANYAEQFLRWEQRSVDAAKKAKEPFKKEVDNLNRAWSPIESKARDAKLAIKQSWLRPYLIERQRKENAALIDQARDPQTIIAGAKAGSGERAASLRTKWRAEVRDYRHFLEWLMGHENLDAELLAAMDKIANKLVHARVENIPGVAQIEEPVVI